MLLSVVPIDVPPFGLICYNNYTDTKYIINNNTLDSIDIQIKGEDENYINFNNIDWCMKLKIDITRKYNKVSMPLILNSYKTDEPKNEDNIIKNDFDLLTYNTK